MSIFQKRSKLSNKSVHVLCSIVLMPRHNSFQCEKCDKVFISEVYLICHEKRRHSSSKTDKSSEGSPKTFADKCQQTETGGKLALKSSQCSVSEKMENVKEAKENDEVEMIKKENKIKIKKLEKELEDVKSRLKKAESTLTMKCETPISSLPQSVSFPNPGPSPNPGSIFYPSMLQWIPSYLPQPRFNYFNYTQGYESLVSENEPRENCNFNNLADSRAADSKNFSDDEPSLNSGLEGNLRGNEMDEMINDSLSESRKNNRTRYSEKENIDPTEEKVFVNARKTRVLPGKVKSFPQTNMEKHMALEELKTGPEEFRRDLITVSSTPLNEKHETQVEEKIAEESENEKAENSSASLSNKGMSTYDRKPKSFLKKIFVKKSPKLEELGKNLRTSLTNLYDSVSHGGKEGRKAKESTSTVMDGLDGELRKLGVDPQWSGIPKSTVRRKLKILKHRRKLITKENPLYPAVRKGIEKNVLQRLDNYTTLNRKKGVVDRESNEQEFIEVKSLDTSYKTPSVETESNSDSESESDFDSLEASRDGIHELKMTWQKEGLEKDVSSNGNPTVEKDFDFSVFHVSKERDSKQSRTRGGLVGVIEDLEIVSDLDSQQSDDADNFNCQVLERKMRKREENAWSNEKERKGDFSEGKHPNTPKSTLRSLSKPQGTSSKKKVVFRDLSENKEDETKEIGMKSSSTRQSIGSEDTWASKSNWDSCDWTLGAVG